MNEMRTTSRKTRVGKVVSDKMDKTVVVIVEDNVAVFDTHLTLPTTVRV